MPTLSELYEQRARVWDTMQGVLVGDELSAEERAKYDAAESDFDKLTADIKRAEGLAERAKSLELSAEKDAEDIKTAKRGDESKTEEIAYREAFVAYVTQGAGALTSEQRAALSHGESRAQTLSTSGGGYLIPQGFRAKLIEALKAYGNVRQVAEVIPTDSGNALPWPTVDDTSNTGRLLSVNTQATTTDLAFGTAQLGAYTFSSDAVLVPLQLLQDAPWLDIESFLARKLGERISRAQGSYFTTGTGSSQPQGISYGATTGVTAANGNSEVTAVKYDSLVDLIHSVDAAYRAAGNCKWMVHDATLAILRKLKDSQNRPLWEPSLTVGDPDQLLGYPVVVNNNMATMAASAKSMLFGDFFQGFVIRDVQDISMIRMAERYADYLQVGFLAWARSDSLVQNSAAYKQFVNAAS